MIIISIEVKCLSIIEGQLNFERFTGKFRKGIINIKNECLFSGFMPVMGNESDRAQDEQFKSSENCFTIHAICLSCAQIPSP